jgi:hypothetical protein
MTCFLFGGLNLASFLYAIFHVLLLGAAVFATLTNETTVIMLNGKVTD